MQINSNQYYKQQNTAAFGCKKCEVLDRTLGAYGLKAGKIPVAVGFSTKLGLAAGRLAAFHEFKEKIGISSLANLDPSIDKKAEAMFNKSHGVDMQAAEKALHDETISKLDDHYSGLINSGNTEQLTKEIQDLNNKPIPKPETAVVLARQLVNFADKLRNTAGKLPESEKKSTATEMMKDFFGQVTNTIQDNQGKK